MMCSREDGGAVDTYLLIVSLYGRQEMESIGHIQKSSQENLKFTWLYFYTRIKPKTWLKTFRESGHRTSKVGGQCVTSMCHQDPG